MADAHLDLGCRLALAFVTEAVSLSLSERPWAELTDKQIERYVTASDGQLQRCMAAREFDDHTVSRWHNQKNAAVEWAAAQ